MNQQIIDSLSHITEEESQLIKSNGEIYRHLYQSDANADADVAKEHYEVDAKKLLDAGKLKTRTICTFSCPHS